ncbi:MAG: NAD(P)/FAD-dependent oxidoreductase [Solirubrobacteraceae bacterium]
MPAPATPAATYDVVVVGAGLAGLSAAWALVRRGASVLVVDRDAPGAATSHVAAGMIAPVTEAESDHLPALRLGVAARTAWPAFARELEAASAIELPLLDAGSLAIARDRDEAEALERFRLVRERMGLQVERLLPSAARRLEPALAPTLRAALAVPDDLAVDPRRVVQALVRAITAAGGVVRTGVAVRSVRVEDGRATGVELDDVPRRAGRDGLMAIPGGDGPVATPDVVVETGWGGAAPRTLAAGAVLLATGPWAGGGVGVPDGDRVPVRPVKGQLLILRDPDGPGLVSRVLRFALGGGYVVPRPDGRYVVGGTVEEQGFDRTVTALAVHDLLRDAAELVPGLLELRLEESIAGLRPATPDGMPTIGPAAMTDGLWWCAGHYRNGVLWASVTGDLLADAMGLDGGTATRDPDRGTTAAGGATGHGVATPDVDPRRFANAPGGGSALWTMGRLANAPGGGMPHGR